LINAIGWCYRLVAGEDNPTAKNFRCGGGSGASSGIGTHAGEIQVFFFFILLLFYYLF
jgi:hypothetical protein